MTSVYLWVDDVRQMPDNYDYWFKSVWDFIRHFNEIPSWYYIIDLDHDAGDYERLGGDYYNILKWMEWFFQESDYIETHVLFKFHTANPVGKQNMINICERNNWKYEA